MRRRQGGLIMYVARFSYDVLPVNRQQALDFIRRELQAAQQSGLTARILVPLTRGQGGGAALQFEVELANLDQLDQFRNRGVGSSKDTGHWMYDFSKILTAPHVWKSCGPKSSDRWLPWYFKRRRCPRRRNASPGTRASSSAPEFGLSIDVFTLSRQS